MDMVDRDGHVKCPPCGYYGYPSFTRGRNKSWNVFFIRSHFHSAGGIHNYYANYAEYVLHLRICVKFLTIEQNFVALHHSSNYLDLADDSVEEIEAPPNQFLKTWISPMNRHPENGVNFRPKHHKKNQRRSKMKQEADVKVEIHDLTGGSDEERRGVQSASREIAQNCTNAMSAIDMVRSHQHGTATNHMTAQRQVTSSDISMQLPPLHIPSLALPPLNMETLPMVEISGNYSNAPITSTSLPPALTFQPVIPLSENGDIRQLPSLSEYELQKDSPGKEQQSEVASSLAVRGLCNFVKVRVTL